MSLWSRLFEERRRRRSLDETAAALDAALSGAAPPPPGFSRGVELARSMRGSFEVAAEPPRSALVALRAGLALQHQKRTAPEKRRIGALLAATASVVVVIGALTMIHRPGPKTTWSQAQDALGQLDQHVKGLQSAIESGDSAKMRSEINAAQAAADEAQSVVERLPNAPERAIAVEATKQRVQDVTWLSQKARQSLAQNGGVFPTSSTAAPPPSTSTTVVSTSTTPPTTLKPPPPTTTVPPTTSTTEPPPTTTTTTEPPPTTTTTTPPQTTTTAPPGTTTTTPGP